MAYKVLYRKYRPDSFDSVVGQDYTVKMLKHAISSGKNAHAYIFTGPRGTGKTSSAKIFAKALNCEHPIDGNPCNECKSCQNFKENPDIIEIDAASNNGVDEIRELINNVKLVPSFSKYKVYIIDEVHMLTASAFNALLLTLEEPPSHVVFILATTDIQDVPITILSRCQRFDFRPIGRKAISDRLRFISNEEGINVTDEALNEIAIISAGGMRDALGMLDQLANDGKEISVEMVSSYFGSISNKKIDELLTSIFENNSKKVLEILGNIKESGTNYAVFVEKLIERLRKLAIDVKLGKASIFVSYENIYNMIFDLNSCLTNLNININPYVLIEVVLFKYVNLGNNGGSENYFPGNKNDDVLGNNSNKESKKSVDDSEKYLTNVEKNVSKVASSMPLRNVEFDINVRINNTFVDANKDFKEKVSVSWIDFMNFLMSHDRNFVSLLADVKVLAVSSRYILIESSVDSTNELINSNIGKLEKFYKEFSGESYYFAAVNVENWKKEVEKYRINRKNKIQYMYMEENISYDSDSLVSEEMVSDSSSIEELGKDVFGTFEIED